MEVRKDMNNRKLKADYGLMGPDAPLFNGLGATPEVPPVRARRGSTAPVLA
jgi:hypothetical protein